MKKSALLLSLLVVSACGPGRDYRQPEVKSASAWHGEQAQGDVPLSRWWTAFGDQTLDALVDDSLAHNLDVAIAVSRIEEARALRSAVEWHRLPDVDATGSAKRSQTSSNSSAFANSGILHNTYEVGFDANWEIDLFGILNRYQEAGDANLQALFAARGEVLSSVAAETARAYLDLSAASELLVVANEDLAVQRQLSDLVTARRDLGIATDADVAQAQAEVASQEAALPDLHVRSSDAVARLSLLTAHDVTAATAASDRFVSEHLPEPAAMFAAGLPSEVVWRRPDLRQAERRFAESVAQVGIQEADLYPRFSLLGSFGFESEQTSNLFDGPSKFWSLGPAMRWPLLQRGYIRKEVQAANARARQAELIYQRQVLAAFSEVEQTLVALARAHDRVKASDAAAEANRRALALTQVRYEHGAEPFLTVLVQSHSSANARRAAIEARRTRALSVVALAKALGGGWDPPGAQKPERQ